MNSLRWWCSSSLTQKLDGFLLQNNYHRDRQPLHKQQHKRETPKPFYWTSGKYFWKGRGAGQGMHQHLPARDTISDALTGALPTDSACSPSHWLLHQPTSQTGSSEVLGGCWSSCQQFQKQAQCLQGTEGQLPPPWAPCVPTSEHLGQHEELAGTHSLQKCHHILLNQQGNVKKYMTCRKQKDATHRSLCHCFNSCPNPTAPVLIQYLAK